MVCACSGTIVVLLTIGVAFYAWLKHRYQFFEKAAIPFVKPVLFLGNFWKSNLRKQHIVYDLKELYEALPDAKYMGVYQFMLPIILVRDLDLIKQIAVKDFDHFTDHQTIVDEDIEPLFGRNLLSLKGQKWKDMRSTLSPAFTGSKIRKMCGFVSECGQQMTNYIEDCMSFKGQTFVDFEVKDLCIRYMNDVIASTAFGLKVDSFKEPDNDFFTIGRRATNFQGFQYLKIMVAVVAPKLAKRLHMKIFPQDVVNFYERLIQDSMDHREAESIYRPDMIHLLNEARKGLLKHDGKNDQDAGFATAQESDIGIAENKTKWEDRDLIAQAILFFLAGFDTTATVMSFLLYELALNPDIQKRLQEEIDENVSEHGNNATYDVIHSMTYCDMVLSETLRKWPPSGLADRECTKDFQLPASGNDGTPYTVKKGQIIWFPIYALHHDANYWKDPEKFDPERFSDGNKGSIKSFTYMPFGIGPRNCIGSRFALMESKIMMYHLLSKYNVEVNSDTQIPIKLAANAFVVLRGEKGISLRITSRKIK